MTLDSQQIATLHSALSDIEFRGVLQAAFDTERERWERMALEATNSDEDAKAKRCANFAASYKSIMSRLLAMARVEDDE